MTDVLSEVATRRHRAGAFGWLVPVAAAAAVGLAVVSTSIAIHHPSGGARADAVRPASAAADPASSKPNLVRRPLATAESPRVRHATVPNLVARGFFITATGPNKYPTLYAGLREDAFNQRLIVYVTRHDAAAERDLGQALPAGAIEFSIVPRSWAELQALDDQVTAVWMRLARDGQMEFLAAGADAATGREEITVVDLTPSKAAFLNAELGAGNIELDNGSLSDMPRAV